MASPSLQSFKSLFISILVVSGLCALLLFISAVASAPSEISYLKEHPALTFDELADYFSELSEAKGALYAFNVLREAPLPPNIDTHLLGHIVGDALYQEKGTVGIDDCTHDFRNACSHAIVVGTLTEFGEGGLEKIRDACTKAPGGKGAYTMCFHGLGHGIFSYTDNNLEATVSMCKKTGTAKYQEREFIECFGGAVMELVGGIGHDQESLARARADYFSEANPLAPCNTPLVPSELRPICYTYLTPHLFASGGGDAGSPGNREFTGAFSLCERISPTERASREACFGGVGKELPTLVASRDIRAIDTLPEEKLRTLYSWCALSKTWEGEMYCVRAIVQSLFWGGENDPRAAVLFCSIGAGEEVRRLCFEEYTAAVSFYFESEDRERQLRCNLAPSQYRAPCDAS